MSVIQFVGQNTKLLVIFLPRLQVCSDCEYGCTLPNWKELEIQEIKQYSVEEEACLP